MSEQTRNYMTDGGDRWVVGGELELADGASITAGGTQASAVADAEGAVAITYSSNDPAITPDGAITVADGSTPTVDELLEAVEELNAAVADHATKIDLLRDALVGAGILAAS